MSSGMLEDLKAAPDGAVILLHACAHNPTGVDPTEEQWEGIRKAIRSKNQLPFFDCAYQVIRYHLLQLSLVFSKWPLKHYCFAHFKCPILVFVLGSANALFLVESHVHLLVSSLSFWTKLLTLLFPQGFASGSLDKDAYAVRLFVADGGECLISQSYAKNMGLYGERVGALSVVSFRK